MGTGKERFAMPKSLQAGLRSLSSYSAMSDNRHDYEPCYFLNDFAGPFRYHCHDFYELYIHYGGAQSYCIDNQMYPLKPCQLMVLPPFHLHGFCGNLRMRNYERAYVYISPTHLRQAGCGQIDLPRLFTAHADKGQYQFDMTPQDAEEAKRLVQRMRAGLNDTTPAGRFANHVLLLSFLQVVCQTVSRSRQHVEPMALNDPMQEILLYINEHFTQPVKLDELAHRFGVSVSYLSHGFVKYTGRSVYEYVLYRRVLMAKEMIASNLSLSEVAYQCGFNDYSSFLRAFNRQAGMSPAAYRRKVRGEAE